VCAGLLELPTTVSLGAHSECDKDRCKMCAKGGPRSVLVPQCMCFASKRIRSESAGPGVHRPSRATPVSTPACVEEPLEALPEMGVGDVCWCLQPPLHSVWGRVVPDTKTLWGTGANRPAPRPYPFYRYLMARYARAAPTAMPRASRAISLATRWRFTYPPPSS
jgi:hypothetical protein